MPAPRTQVFVGRVSRVSHFHSGGYDMGLYDVVAGRRNLTITDHFTGLRCSDGTQERSLTIEFLNDGPALWTCDEVVQLAQWEGPTATAKIWGQQLLASTGAAISGADCIPWLGVAPWFTCESDRFDGVEPLLICGRDVLRRTPEGRLEKAETDRTVGEMRLPCLPGLSPILLGPQP